MSGNSSDDGTAVLLETHPTCIDTESATAALFEAHCKIFKYRLQIASVRKSIATKINNVKIFLR